MMTDEELREAINIIALLRITEEDATSAWDAFDQMVLLSQKCVREAARVFDTINDPEADDLKRWVRSHMEDANAALAQMAEKGSEGRSLD